jgi:hypothetical protein
MQTTNKMKLFFSVLLIAICTVVATGQQNFSTLDAFKNSVGRGENRITVEATGDLNGDNLEDWAGVVHREKSNASPTYQLYILIRQPQGGYHVAQASREEEIPGMGCCWVEDLQISRGSIYIQNNAKTAATMEAAKHQFKYYKGQWRLVGIQIFYTDHSDDTSTDTDMNVLTGDVIEKKSKGDGKPTIIKRKKRFGLYLLKDFDFSNAFGTG